MRGEEGGEVVELLAANGAVQRAVPFARDDHIPQRETVAQEQPLLYGLVSLVLAALSGWLASAAFRLFRA